MRTRTDIALRLLNCLPLKAEIDKRKLTFLGQLCRLNRPCGVKEMFLFRLYSYKLNPQLHGYDNDIYNVLSMCGLETYLDNYLHSLVFPSKSEWKRIINTAVWRHVRLTW